MHISPEHHAKPLGKPSPCNQGKLHSYYHVGEASNALSILPSGLSIMSQSSPQASGQYSYPRAEDPYFPGYTSHAAFAWSRQPTEKYAGFLLFLRIPENTHSCHWPCCFHTASFSAWKLNYGRFKKIWNIYPRFSVEILNDILISCLHNPDLIAAWLEINCTGGSLRTWPICSTFHVYFHINGIA